MYLGDNAAARPSIESVVGNCLCSTAYASMDVAIDRISAICRFCMPS
jgi:hypothetical protein